MDIFTKQQLEAINDLVNLYHTCKPNLTHNYGECVMNCYCDEGYLTQLMYELFVDFPELSQKKLYIYMLATA
jgi:hypothetical protein